MVNQQYLLNDEGYRTSSKMGISQSTPIYLMSTKKFTGRLQQYLRKGETHGIISSKKSLSCIRCLRIQLSAVY